MKKHIKMKLEVTVNDSGFDTPSGGSIKRSENSATVAKLNYPSKHGRLNDYFLGTDIFKIFVGVDAVPDEPNFTGQIATEEGSDKVQFTLQDLGLYRVRRAPALIIDDTPEFNFDGWEVGGAMQVLIKGESGMGIDPIDADVDFFGGTNPKVIIGSSTRFASGVDRLKLMRELAGACYDPQSYPKPPRLYYFYEAFPEDAIKSTIFFRKADDLDGGYPWWTFTYGQNLIQAEPKVKTMSAVNSVTVIGKDGISATYTNSQREKIDKLLSQKPIKDDSLTSRAQCFERARKEVEGKLFKVVNSSITAWELIDAIPGLTIVEILNSPFIYKGNHRIKSLTINFTDTLTVSAEIDNIRPLLLAQIKESIGG